MSRTPRLASPNALRQRPRRAPLAVVSAVTVAALVAGCSSSPSSDGEAPSYRTSADVQARVLPQLAANGEDVAAADDASWVVDATIAGAEEGTAVTLLARTDDGEWETVSDAETDADGHVSLISDTAGELTVVAGDGDDAIGAEVTTDDAPEATFTDDFDDADSVDEVGAKWHTRDQGRTGVRTCSQADPSGADVEDGMLVLSVLEDPSGGECQLPGRRKKYPYRLNGHVGTEGVYGFSSGYAAARIRTQSARGQHAAFWMQAVGGQAEGGPKAGGAEIDVIEYFGDDHPEGGLTSFTYYLDENGEKQTVGGWLPDAEKYGDDWAEKFHVFSVEWTPDAYVFRIDGQVTLRLEGETSGREEFLILSLLSSDYELPRFNGELPEQMEVDWARVWETGPEKG